MMTFRVTNQILFTGQPTDRKKTRCRAQAHGLGFQNLKPEPEALSSHALGSGSAGLSRAGLGRLRASSPSLHITSASGYANVVTVSRINIFRLLKSVASIKIFYYNISIFSFQQNKLYPNGPYMTS